jgi:ribokinase
MNIMPAPAICVVGSINLDMNAYVERFPRVGETMHGLRFATGYGGKGANQAVMAARMGGAVTFVGSVGDDLFGRDMRANLEAEGVATQYITTSPGLSSGVAVITISEQGDNTIIVVAGANGRVDAAAVGAAWDAIASARVLVCQLEIPLEGTRLALRKAREAGVLTIFNPAPATPDLPDELFELSDICCPNETEAEILTGIAIRTDEDAIEAAQRLLQRGAQNVIITLGARGSLLVNTADTQHIETDVVQPVDTVGAGDAFVGSLAYFLAGGKALPDAIRRANQIAAISVQYAGAQSSYPRVKDLPEGLAE